MVKYPIINQFPDFQNNRDIYRCTVTLNCGKKPYLNFKNYCPITKIFYSKCVKYNFTESQKF